MESPDQDDARLVEALRDLAEVIEALPAKQMLRAVRKRAREQLLSVEGRNPADYGPVIEALDSDPEITDPFVKELLGAARLAIAREGGGLEALNKLLFLHYQALIVPISDEESAALKRQGVARRKAARSERRALRKATVRSIAKGLRGAGFPSVAVRLDPLGDEDMLVILDALTCCAAEPGLPHGCRKLLEVGAAVIRGDHSLIPQLAELVRYLTGAEPRLPGLLKVDLRS